MKKFIFAFCLLACGVALLVISFKGCARKKALGLNSTSAPATTEGDVASEVGTANKDVPSPTANVSPTTSLLPANSDSNVYNQQTSTFWRAAIDFYGKVVDEKNDPVEGATVRFNWSELPSMEGAGNTSNATSDSSGLFSLRGKHGPSLNVQVGKDGYLISAKNRLGFSYVMGQEIFSPDPLNPIIFRLQKKGRGTDLITSENGVRMKVTARIPKDNTPVRIDFFQKQVSASGQLEISQIKPPWRDATNWSFRMSISSGGFVENEDEFQFEAPASNYLPTVEYNFTRNETNWTTQVSKQFYIVFGQPRKYGWLRIESNLAQETIFLTYAINPDGSNYLEPK